LNVVTFSSATLIAVSGQKIQQMRHCVHFASSRNGRSLRQPPVT
jgi:hypothetical protein